MRPIGTVVAYVDGSCRKQGQPSVTAGLGAAIEIDNERFAIVSVPVRGPERLTSTVSELHAAQFALRFGAILSERLTSLNFEAPGDFTLLTDCDHVSRGLKNGYNDKFPRLWKSVNQAKGRMDAADVSVFVQLVRAHKGIPGNERANELAREASRNFRGRRRPHVRIRCQLGGCRFDVMRTPAQLADHWIKWHLGDAGAEDAVSDVESVDFLDSDSESGSQVGSESDSDVELSSGSEDNLGSFYCPSCDEQFPSEIALQGHYDNNAWTDTSSEESAGAENSSESDSEMELASEMSNTESSEASSDSDTDSYTSEHELQIAPQGHYDNNAWTDVSSEGSAGAENSSESDSEMELASEMTNTESSEVSSDSDTDSYTSEHELQIAPQGHYDNNAWTDVSSEGSTGAENSSESDSEMELASEMSNTESSEVSSDSDTDS